MNPRTTVQALGPEHLDTVLAIEQTAYSHPWRRGQFADAHASGYWLQGLWQGPELLGYLVAMPGVQETHLLNLTVAPDHQGQGHSHPLMQALLQWSLAQGAQSIWLEVRQSNARAQAVYQRAGFVTVGLRKDYYPAGRQQREHAVVMQRPLTPSAPPAPPAP